MEALRGSIPDADDLARHERAGRIHWWGYLDPTGISTVLLRALALVVHSRYEPGGRVVLEAMTEGVPVIATPHGFATTLVRDWCTGFLVEFGDQEALGRRMEHFVRQPLLRNALGGAARAAATAALGAWSFLDIHCDVYGAVIAATALPVGPPALPPLACQFPRFPPTYPYGHTPPSDGEVADFVERAAGSPATVHPGPVSRRSVMWRAEVGGGEWIVKWPAPVLRQRPLWDEDDGPPALTHSGRWASCAFACWLPFHLPLAGEDASVGLLLFRSVPPAPLDWLDPESVARVAALLRLPRGAALPEERVLYEVFGRSWRDASDPELREAAARYRRVLGDSGRPWYQWSHASLRHAWVCRARGVSSGRLGLPPEWALAVGRAADMFIELAEAESALPIGPCHGTLTCAPLRTCNIQLEEGERPPAGAGEIKPYAGDLERWFVGVTPGPGNTTLVVVQPTDCNLTTNLTIPTDRRLYHLTLDSPPCAARDTATQNPDLPYDRLVRFYYPDDLLRRLAAREYADAEATRAEEARQIPVATPAFDASALDFGYTVCRDRGFPWLPEQVFADGSHTYIRLPEGALRGAVPALFEVGERGEMVLINYALRGQVYVADRVLRRGVLILGTGRPGGELRLLVTTDRRDCSRR